MRTRSCREPERCPKSRLQRDESARALKPGLGGDYKSTGGIRNYLARSSAPARHRPRPNAKCAHCICEDRHLCLRMPKDATLIADDLKRRCVTEIGAQMSRSDWNTFDELPRLYGKPCACGA